MEDPPFLIRAIREIRGCSSLVAAGRVVYLASLRGHNFIICNFLLAFPSNSGNVASVGALARPFFDRMREQAASGWRPAASQDARKILFAPSPLRAFLSAIVLTKADALKSPARLLQASWWDKLAGQAGAVKRRVKWAV